MTSDPKKLDAGCRARVFTLLCENDEMLLEMVKQLHDDMDEMYEYTDQLRNEFDRVYDALNKANAMISGLRMNLIFQRYERSTSVLDEIDKMAWNVLFLMIAGDGEEFLPYSPGYGLLPPVPINQTEPTGVEYGEGNLKVTNVAL